MSTAAPSLRTLAQSLFGGLLSWLCRLRPRPCEVELVAAGGLAAGDAAPSPRTLRACRASRRECRRRSASREARVHLFPGLGGVGDELAVLRHLGRECEVHVLRLESPIAALGVDGEDDAVIAELDLDDLLHAVLGALFDLVLLDLARRIRDVDRGVAEALAELLDAGAAAARLRRSAS